MSSPRSPNRLLNRLPQADYALLEPHLESVAIKIREVLCQPGQAQKYAYFPTTSMLSSIILLSDGTAVEAATIGNEGMAGFGLLVKETASPYRVVQQIHGETLRIEARQLQHALASSSLLRDLLQRYVFTLLQQTGQNAACNLHHRIGPRMSRWLLQTSDRAGRHEFNITQEFLSEMLGVSRQSVNGAARQLQEAGLIEYRRGYVAILDRQKLESNACECYAVFNETYARYMHDEIVKPQ